MAKKPTLRRTIKVKPSKDHPIPYDDAPQVATTSMEELKVLADTADALRELGSLPEVDERTLAAEKRLIEQAAQGKKPEGITSLPAAMGAKIFLERYAHQLGHDMGAIRSALLNKLLELATDGDPKIELRAIELLGKHSDIALFTERSEITVNYNTPEALESAIKERVQRLLKSEESYALPSTLDLEEESAILDAEYAEVSDEEAQKYRTVRTLDDDEGETDGEDEDHDGAEGQT